MRNQKKAFYKRKTVLAAGTLCLLSVLGLSGIYRLESEKKVTGEELVNWEETAPDVRKAVESDLAQEEKPSSDNGAEAVVSAREEEKEQLDNPKAEVGDEVAESVVEEEVPETAQASVQNAVNLNFRPEMGMIWPVEGNVILDYSMDHSIYFPTLDQYKYNPAIAIQSEVGTPVLAAAAGTIESIVETNETGLTMTVNLGNGYEAVYGQLADISLSTGSYVEAGSQIATVATPSIYYQTEGDNLYFQVLKDGQPADPLDFIK